MINIHNYYVSKIKFDFSKGDNSCFVRKLTRFLGKQLSLDKDKKEAQ